MLFNIMIADVEEAMRRIKKKSKNRGKENIS